MFSLQKTIIFGGLGIALLLVAHSLSVLTREALPSPGSRSETGSAAEPRPLAGSAFLDSEGLGGGAPERELYPEKLPEQAIRLGSGQAPQKENVSRESLVAPNVIQRIGESVSRILSPAPEALPLPAVLDGEIAIDSEGAQTPLEYFIYLALHYREVSFDYFRLNAFIDEEAQDYPSPPELIGRYLADGTLPPAHSLETWKELAQAKIEFERRVKVAPRAAGTSKAMIGLDRLVIALIDAFGDVQEGRMPRSELETLYERYRAAEEMQFAKFAGEAGLVRADPGDTVLARALKAVGLREVAHALSPTPPFGGPVIYKTTCSCSAGSAIIVGPPKSGAFFLPVVYALFAHYKPSIGNFVLGLSTIAPIPCLQGIPPECTTDKKIPGTQGPVIMTGTSK